MTVVNCAYIGGLTGTVKRRGRGVLTVFCAALVAGSLFGVLTVTALAIIYWDLEARVAHFVFS